MDRDDAEHGADDAGEVSERRVGTLDELQNLDAVVRERGYFLLLRHAGEMDGEDTFEAAPARLFGDPEGEIGRLRIGQDAYVVHLTDLEHAVLEGGNFRVARHAGELHGEDMFQLFDGQIIVDGTRGLPELCIGDERYLLILDDFQDAVTDPGTYDPNRDGPPYPIDVLRDPPQPE